MVRWFAWSLPIVPRRGHASLCGYPVFKSAKETVRHPTLNAYSVIQGDVVVSRKGNVGQAALFREGLEPGIIHSDVLRIRVNGAKLNPEYLVYYLHNSQEVKRQIEVVSPGSIMPGTNVTKLKSVAIVCPPIELQDAFAIFAQGADRKRAELQKRVDMLSQERELLLNQYLA